VKTSKINFRVSDDEFYVWKALSAKSGRSVSAMLRDFLPPMSILAGVLAMEEGQVLDVVMEGSFSRG